MDGVTYDTGALIAADRNDRRMWALHASFLALELSPIVPTPVLAEVWRGGSRQASLARFLALCTMESLTKEQAKAVGVVAARADHDDIVDATVVEGAVRRHDAVVTSNPTHISKIADAARSRLKIETAELWSQTTPERCNREASDGDARSSYTYLHEGSYIDKD